MVPAAFVDATIEDLMPLLESGDIVIDGGNSHYQDDIARAKKLAARGLHYVDVGTSGGVWGLERGYCLMIGGEDETVHRLEPIFETLAPGVGSIPRTAGGERRHTPSTGTCTADPPARGISSRWSTTGSSTVSWPRMPKA